MATKSDHVMRASKARMVPRVPFLPPGMGCFAYDDAPLPIDAGQSIS
jgi:protein-L-isoaspartate O-methyltransferase